MKDNLEQEIKKLQKTYTNFEIYKDIFTHDIRNVLQTIRSSLDLICLELEDCINENQTIKKTINIAKKQIDRGTKLVDNLTLLTKVESKLFNLKPMDFKELILKAIELVKISYPNKEIDIKINYSVDKNYINANEILLDIYENILRNAVKFNREPKTEIIINISGYKKNNQNFIRFEFTDNGIGISDEFKKIIFHGFKTDRINFRGMGLGLSVVKKVIKKYNGKIWVENRIKDDHSKGSKFIIEIPNED